MDECNNVKIYLSKFKYKCDVYASPDPHAGSVTVQKELQSRGPMGIYTITANLPVCTTCTRHVPRKGYKAERSFKLI